MSGLESAPFRKTLGRMEKIMDRSAGNPDLATLFEVSREVYNLFTPETGAVRRIYGSREVSSVHTDVYADVSFIDHEADYRRLLGRKLMSAMALVEESSPGINQLLRQKIMKGLTGSKIDIDARSYVRNDNEGGDMIQGHHIFSIHRRLQPGTRKYIYALKRNELSASWGNGEPVIIVNDDIFEILTRRKQIEPLAQSEIQAYCDLFTEAVRSRVEDRIRLLQ